MSRNEPIAVAATIFSLLAATCFAIGWLSSALMAGI
jgi:hypothetical protein